MSKVLDLATDEVIDYCTNTECGTEIILGQTAWMYGHEMCCSSKCLLTRLGVVAVTAGRDSGDRSAR
ncbi:hypothetical protein J2T13_003627 [Paenibacillus sp. DS2015]|uniref:hypothetical protein n=1 Tax=Paenibacillus sp. DS2015 TaxID=3373917 RepID=UPI003D1BA103